jgi:predicted DNA-binding transcriptional regulator AlpA
MANPVLENQSLLVNAGQAATLCGVSRTSWWRMDRSGRCPLPIRLGGRVLWRRNELAAWVDAGAPPRHRWQDMWKGGAA